MNLTKTQTASNIFPASAKSLAEFDRSNLQGVDNTPMLCVFFYVPTMTGGYCGGFKPAVFLVCGRSTRYSPVTHLLIVMLAGFLKYKETIMSTALNFNFHNTDVRVISDDPLTPLFVAKDVALALGYKNTNDAIKKHCKDGVAKRYPITDKLGRTQEVAVIGEPDLYRLIFGSKLKSAVTFQDWVFEEVLPSIRKTGEYVIPTLTPAQQHHIQAHIKKLVATQVGTTYAGLYGSVKNKFKVGSYKNIPPERYGELCQFLKCEPLEGELLPKEEKQDYSDLPHFSCKENKQRKLLPFNALFDCGWNMKMSELFTFVTQCQKKNTPCVIDDLSGIKQEMRSLMNIVEIQNNRLSRIHDLSKH